MKNKTIGIVSALKAEAEIIINKMADKEIIFLGALKFYHGTIGNNKVVVTISSCGKVAAGIYTEAMILGFHPDVIINPGIGGALSENMKIFDIAVATRLVQHDMDTSAIGDPKGMISGICVTFIDTDEKTSDSLFEFASKAGNAKRGIIASGDKFIADVDEKRAINKEYGADVCEMEGAAVAQTCYTNNVKFAVIRIVSDSLSEKAAVEYAEFASIAAKTLSEIILKFIEA